MSTHGRSRRATWRSQQRISSILDHELEERKRQLKLIAENAQSKTKEETNHYVDVETDGEEV